MKIRSFTHHDLNLAFADGKYVMSHVVQENLPVRILTLTAEDGTVGTGEVIRKADVDVPKAEEKEIELLSHLAGKSIADLPALVGHLARTDKSLRGLAFAMETAYLDWVGRWANQPLYALLGGRKSEKVPNYYSVSAGSRDHVLGDVQTRGTGAPVVQIKLGVGDLADDIAVTRTVFESLEENQILLADFNGALSVSDACEALSSFNHPRLYWEEPCLHFDENTEATRRTGAQVMFDQCVDRPVLFSRACAEGVAAAVAIKPAFLGGISCAAAARDLCVDAGMKVRVDGPWCGHIAAAAAVHLACGTDPDMLIASCDLRQPLKLAEDWGGIVHVPGRYLSVTDAPGHGVAVPDYTH